MSAGQSPPPPPDPGALLRAHGLRVTPQRRAILDAFSGASTEHLSADEVHARASASVPEISRGTVYAALAELTELGLLAAVGSPEPVRYETNVAKHQHFRCRLCLRLHDVELPTPSTRRLRESGFVVESMATSVEGICVDCVQYDVGLREGVRVSLATRGPTAADLPDGLACAVITTPLGPVMLAATANGLVRAIFENHVDAPAVREMARRRRGGRAARGHIADASAYIDAYFASTPAPPTCAVDWDALDNASVATLLAVQAVGLGQEASYETVRSDAGAHDRGLSLGTNPLVIIVPCHRVTRGREVPDAYVGGPERKRCLRRHDRTRPDERSAR